MMLDPKRLERFMAKVHPEPMSGCWLWVAAADDLGYGRFSDTPGHVAVAHRVSYEHFKGPIAPGLVIDHLCRTPACVNPDHLEPVTQAENLRRGVGQIWKTHCRKGHPFTPDNTLIENGAQLCATCKRATRDRVLARRKAGLVVPRGPRKTHCSGGHEYTLENTIQDRYGRRCKQCHAVHQRRWYEKKRMEA